jgi:hypothetical protein
VRLDALKTYRQNADRGEACSRPRNHDGARRRCGSPSGALRPFIGLILEDSKGSTVIPSTRPPLARIEHRHGQMYLAPSGALKQPTDSGNSVFGSQSTACGKKIAKAIVKKKIT